VGFDAYKKLVASDIDIVILATPPGYRPMPFEAAVGANNLASATAAAAVLTGAIRGAAGEWLS